MTGVGDIIYNLSPYYSPLFFIGVGWLIYKAFVPDDKVDADE